MLGLLPVACFTIGLGKKMHSLSLSSLLLAAAFLTCGIERASAIASAPVVAGEATVRLLAGDIDNTNSAPVIRGGLEITLTPGWKTYWRYPGDAGVPPRFDWAGSENVAHVDVLYPAPKRIPDESGQTSIGYEQRVIFPLRVRPADPKLPVKLNLKFDFATCEKICIPADAKLSLVVPLETASEIALDGAAARVPAKEKLSDLEPPSIVSVALDRGKRADGKDARILVTIDADNDAPLDLFAEGPDDTWTIALPKRLTAAASKSPTFDIPLDGSRYGKAEVPPRLRLTLVAGAKAIEIEVPLD